MTKTGTEVFRTPHETDLWGWEVRELARIICGDEAYDLAQGLQTMLDVIDTIETARKAAGIRFPGDSIG